jgi:hypothetical protein
MEHVVTDHGCPLAPAFYAAPSLTRGRAVADWWVVLHPPYTLWHLSYIAIGASVASRFDGGRLVATLVAFFLAVGVCAHALDELHGRPLRTGIPSWLLVSAAAASLAGAVVLGIVGLARVGPGLAVFIVVGVALTLGYNLELLGGRLHNDVTFAAAWGAFPVLTGYYAQAATVRFPAMAAAAGAYWLSAAQRSLSTPARTLRRRVVSLDGTVKYADGRTAPVTTTVMLAPLETALRAMAYAVVALAVALVVYRLVDA